MVEGIKRCEVYFQEHGAEQFDRVSLLFLGCGEEREIGGESRCAEKRATAE